MESLEHQAAVVKLLDLCELLSGERRNGRSDRSHGFARMRTSDRSVGFAWSVFSSIEFHMRLLFRLVSRTEQAHL